MAQIKLPRLLEAAAKRGLRQAVAGSTVANALEDLFSAEPALRPHLLDEVGRIRPHVLVFVDGKRADLESEVAENSELIVLQAVSGGGRSQEGTDFVGRVKTNQMA